ncbi:hypothetical protein D3C78_1601030 [compost metagenome]
MKPVGGLAFCQAFEQHIEQHPVHRQEEHQADQHLEAVIHQRDFHPVGGHKGIAAFVEGDKEEGQGIADIAQEHGRGGGNPPGAALA